MSKQTTAGYAAFETLVISHYDMLLRLAVHHTENRAEAEDIVQDVFLSLLQSGKQFRDDEHAKAFLLRAVINRCKDYHKSARRTNHIALSEAEGNLVQNPFAETELAQAMQTLRPDFRNVIYLHYYEQYSIKEIAALLGKSSNTVSSWLTRARAQLKEVLDYEDA